MTSKCMPEAPQPQLPVAARQMISIPLFYQDKSKVEKGHEKKVEKGHEEKVEKGARREGRKAVRQNRTRLTTMRASALLAGQWPARPKTLVLPGHTPDSWCHGQAQQGDVGGRSLGINA